MSVAHLKRLTQIEGAVLAVALFACCAIVAQAVRTEAAAGVDFSKYRTYKWVEVKGYHPNPTVDQQIKQSIDSQLAAKGLTKVECKSDLTVDYQTTIQQAAKWEPYEDWTDTTFGGQRFQQYKKVVIEKGTLVLDIYDVPAKHLVWTGRALKTLDENSSPENRRKNLDKAVKELLANFPPK